MQQGQGPGLSLRDLGEIGGEGSVALLQTEMPSHSHGAQAGAGGGQPSPSGNVRASGLKTGPSLYSASGTGNVQMSPAALSIAGGNLPHNNMQPYLCLNFCIALQGIFPPRT